MISRVGIIGLGDMGKLYARELARAGLHVRGCDPPEKREALAAELGPLGIAVEPDADAVIAQSELVVISVEAERVAELIARHAPRARAGTIFGAQTAVKSIEIPAFEKHLPPSCPIVTCHSLHGPSLSPRGQVLALIRHRADDAAYARAREAFAKLGSRLLELTDYRSHDRMMADIQSVTHVTFESMGTAWSRAGRFPWENPAYLGGIDNVKVLVTLRIFAGKAHVYGELAMLNPFAREQIRAYRESVAQLFALMEGGRARELRSRIGEIALFARKSPLLLSDSVLGEYGLGLGPELRRPNSHLSLLAMADAWHRLGINPYGHLAAETPVFRLRLGIVEYLFRHPELREESIAAALGDAAIRADDLQFRDAVASWAELVERGDFPGYQAQFDSVRGFFRPRLADGMARSTALIARLAEDHQSAEV